MLTRNERFLAWYSLLKATLILTTILTIFEFSVNLNDIVKNNRLFTRLYKRPGP